VTVLEHAGAVAEFAAAAQGHEAAAQALSRAVAEQRPYRALVLDQREGEFDGFALFASLSSAVGEALPPALLFTSAGERGDAARCRELGIAGYLSSPAGDGDLVEALRHLRPATAVAAPLVTRHLLREESGRRRVLVVDDNSVNRKVASRLLERSGFEVATAVHGGEAVEQFRQGGWDMVLMDVQMPEMDGLEATRRIRELEREGSLPRTPILAVTAHTLDSDRKAVLEAGMDELVPKPIVADHMLATMQRFLADAPVAVSGNAPPNAIEDVIDWHEALNRMDGDAEVLDQLLRIFLIDSTNMMRRLEDARESGEAAQLERAAHGLKGASGTISARHVEVLARNVEELARAGRMNEARDVFDDLRREMQRLVHVLESLPSSPQQEDAA
jgi:CheY-like chemotaxis protein/HPt (histidine-containing phosphotransfer) domain-containing protein